MQTAPLKIRKRKEGGVGSGLRPPEDGRIKKRKVVGRAWPAKKKR